MSNQALNQLLANDPTATVTNLSWDEVQKFAHVGDIIKQHGRTIVVARKEFVQQLDNSYEPKLFSAE